MGYSININNLNYIVYTILWNLLKHFTINIEI